MDADDVLIFFATAGLVAFILSCALGALVILHDVLAIGGAFMRLG